jgi:hypothetical protein
MLYLVGTMEYIIHYSGYPMVLEGYSDANWISDVDELYVMSGYVFTLGSATVSWMSCKQTILTRSTMEEELAALDTATVEANWLRELLMDLSIIEKPLPQSNGDSQSRQFKGQYEVIKTHQKTNKVCQENEKFRGYYIELYPY